MSSVPIRTMKKEILQKHNKQTQITSVFSSQRAAMQKKNSYQKLAGGPKGRSLDFFVASLTEKFLKVCHLVMYLTCILSVSLCILSFQKNARYIKIQSRHIKIHLRYIPKQPDTLRYTLDTSQIHVYEVYLMCIFVYLEFSNKCQIHKDTIQTYKDTIEIHSKTTRYTKIHIRYIMDTLHNSSFCRIEISHNNVRAYTHFPQQQKAMLDLNPCE